MKKILSHTALLLALVLTLLLLPIRAHAQDKAAARKIVQNFLKCWETNDAQTFAALLHDQVLFAYPGGRLNKEQLVTMFREYHEEKRDIKIYFWDQFLTEGEQFASAYQFAATDRKTGKRQAVGTGIVGKIKDGKIILFKEYYDEEVAIQQYAGKLPLDEGEVSPWPASIWLRPETID